MLVVWGAAVALFSAVLLFQGQHKFVPGACERIEAHLSARVVGQDMALAVLINTICHHLEQPQPTHPLILSVHGPPGVGKTLTHRELAKALFYTNPNKTLDCPGRDCPAYKVVLGLDYEPARELESLEALRTSIIAHVQAYPDTLLVVEEYDKLTCAARNMLVKLFRHPEAQGFNFNRAIILLESNIGSRELETVLTRVEDWPSVKRGKGGALASASKPTTPSKKVSPDEVDSLLRDIVFAKWQLQACSDFDDINKFTNTISYFLPYFPLQAASVRKLIEMGLEEQREKLARKNKGKLEWDLSVVDTLLSKDRWALPGGFVDEYEHIDDAAARELQEETSIDPKHVQLQQVETFGGPGRDPRGWTVTVAYACIVDSSDLGVKAADDAKEAAWFDVAQLPPLAFDHKKVVKKCLLHLAGREGLERETSTYLQEAAAKLQEPWIGTP